MNVLLGMLLPRFITEKVVLELEGDEYVPQFPYRALEDGETYYATGTVKGFNLFGFVLFPMLDMDSIVVDNHRTPYASGDLS